MLLQLFRNQYTSSTTCALALLLFFLTFVELKCKKIEEQSKNPAFFQNDLPPATMTGFGMMTGKVQTKIALPGAGNFTDNLVRPQWLVVVAFFSGLIALVFSFIDFSGRPFLVVAATALAAICLIIVRFQFAGNIKNGIHLQHATPEKNVDVNFKVCLYLSEICFATTAFLAYQYGLLSITDKFEFEEEPELRYRS
jgi:hypothetical protein